jgi:hypothetical protein
VKEYQFEVTGRDGWNGREAHDFIGFDEGAQLARSKVHFVLGWLRSVDPNQRRRCVIASNRRPAVMAIGSCNGSLAPEGQRRYSPAE